MPGSHQLLFAKTLWSIENHFRWIAYQRLHIVCSIFEFRFAHFYVLAIIYRVKRNGIDSFRPLGNIRLFWLINTILPELIKATAENEMEGKT